MSKSSRPLIALGLGGLLVAAALYRRRTQARPAVTAVADFDPDQLSGSWYEIARTDNPFQKADWFGGKETYTATGEARFDVTYSYRPGSAAAPEKQIRAKLWRPARLAPKGHFKYRPFWPVSADYLVLEIGAANDYLLVGTPDRRMLWLLARRRQLRQQTYQYLIQKAVYLGYDVSRLIRVGQPEPAHA